MQTRRFSTGTLLFLLLSVSGVNAFAQANAGSITGTVQDSSGAVIANAPVEIRETETGALYRSGASETGNYVVRVPAGTYEMTVSVNGFNTFVQTGIPVIEGTATRRDVTLTIGQVGTVVTVTDTAPLLKTESGDVTYRVTTNLANQLPVLPVTGGAGLGNIRNPLAMTQVMPGVDFNGGGFSTLVVNGLPANTQTLNIDGQDATSTLWRGVSTSRAQGSVDAMESMTVQTSNFAAEFGKAGGGAINFTSKSGTNDYHGSVYNYYVNEFLHAGTPNTDYATSTANLAYKSGQHIRNKQRRNDYGFTIGGPVIIPGVYDGHDKTFFFFNFEQFRENQTIANGLTTVPTQAYRDGNFEASGCQDYDVVNLTCRNRQAITLGGAPAVDTAGNPILNGGIYDPASYAIVGGFPTRTLYPNQQIPLTAFDRVSSNIQSQFPLPTNNNLTSNYNIPAYDNFRHNTIPSIKLNHNLNDAWRIDGYWGQTITSQNNAIGFDPKDYPWSSQQSTPYHNHTARINLDGTLTPTLLFHVGIGYFHQREPNVAPQYDQTQIGLPGAGSINAFPYPNAYPTLGALSNGTGGMGQAIGVGFDAVAYEQKPTANLNLTWVKGNHTFKFGGDMTLQGYPTQNRWRANGNFTFNAAQSGNPWTDGQRLNISNPTGSNYASFLLGQPNAGSLAQQTFTRLGGKAVAFFAQDNWKITPKLTLEYGLRYDYQTYLKEQHGRLASAGFNTFNPTVNRLGGLVYENEASCGCNLSSNYPFAFGPRLNAAYQITNKTVFRAGFGVNYNVVQTPAGNNFSVGDYYEINAPGFGITPLTNGLQGGNVFYAGNPYGNTEVVWPVFNPGRFPVSNGGLLPPSSNVRFYHPNSRPGRIMQWSIGIQQEVLPNLVIEASYVGNRSAWFYSPLLDNMSANTLGGGVLANYGLDIHNAADRTLLTQVVGSPEAAARGFGLPYVGFPSTEQVGNSLRPIAQYQTIVPYLGPNRGNTYYDSLQFQATKRYSHNLDLTVNVTWAKGAALGVNSDTDFFLRGHPVVTDVFNRDVNKQINQLVSPLKTVISGIYTTPGLPGAEGWTKFASAIVKDWQIGAVLQYQSGQLLATPNSNNQLSQQLRMNLPNAGAFGAGVANYNPWNWDGSTFYVPGFDPNGSFDPRVNSSDPALASFIAGNTSSTTGACLVAACPWSNPAAGEWGVSSPYYEGFRWQRQPNEAFNIGRNFRMGPEGRYVLNVRAEFQNILNRMFYNAPSTSNPFQAISTTTQLGQVIPTGGFGAVNTLNGAGSTPRTGTIVARFTF